MRGILPDFPAFADVVWVPEPRLGGLTLILCTAGLVLVVVILTVALIRYNWSKKNNAKDNLEMKTGNVSKEANENKES